MDPQFEGMSEGELKKLLDGADDYDERSKIRSAIRTLKKKSSGAGNRNMTGTSVYRRPGFQTPQTVQIPNSVTGNVLPSSVKDGEPIKPPDKNTPTIGYLNATTTVKSPRRTGGKKTPSQSSFATQGSTSKEQEMWWSKSQSSSRSQTPSDTSEYNKTHNRTESADHEVFPEQQSFKEPLKEPTPEPSPEPPREPTPEPPKEPTPEPSPEPPREPTPEPLREPTPEPSPEPPKEPTPEPSPEPTPEPPKEPTPEPTPEPSPEPPRDLTPSPEPLTPSPELEDEEEVEEEGDDKFSDEEDEELQALEAGEGQSSRQQLAAQVPVNKSIPIDVLQKVEPGLEENKDFRTKLRKADDAKIDTKAAFPSQKKNAEQLDFRNVLRKTAGPEKKAFKVEQVDFREKIKRKEDGSDIVDDTSETSFEDTVKHDDEDQLEQNEEEEQYEEGDQDVSPNERVEEEKLDTPEEKSVKMIVEEDSYEVRKETRRKEREEKEREERIREEKERETANTTTTTTDSTNGALEEDSYEARKEARRKAREAKRGEQQGSGGKGKELSYREKQQLEQAKRMEENKKKFTSADQQNGSLDTKPAISRQKSSGNRGAQQLLAWCQHKTKYYENVEVRDFSNSFANGLALCAILHTFVPENIPYDDLSPSNPRENFGVALQVSEDLGIGSFFDVDDLVSVKAPDPKSMMTFLATIYQHFK